jgi:hypothetical protein
MIYLQSPIPEPLPTTAEAISRLSVGIVSWRDGNEVFNWQRAEQRALRVTAAD